MTTEYRCDRCRKIFYDDTTLTVVSIERRVCPMYKRPFERKHYCSECAKKLDEVLEGLRE